MLVRLIKYLEPVRVAQTREAREAIYSFRYRVYHEELGREIGGVDHARKMVVEPEDEAPGVFHLYAGRLDAIRGVGRVRVWAPGQVPEPLARLLSLERVPGIERFGISELGRLMVDRRHRGARVAAALAIAGFEVQANHGVDLAFCYCRPG
ncbi:MAG: GNAT family N-acetyltransferase, partial [Myxococcales bacterium]|nr:GNAT family N-acetyltransferase [Myxococcales bacterium]